MNSHSSAGHIGVRFYDKDGGIIGLDVTEDKKYVTLFKDASPTTFYKVLKDDVQFLQTIEGLEWEDSD
ncbi:hypothetical protein [Paenibacillus paeoniae]|uniref:Uncharacterized protein n=1 Tax=Paenibacillus paeoniae TaxID=2292705 RepID=A0A371P5S9_9BACL|nr:hypothetical protein [Paenibacillus paeoniae]REK71287.1 hypothetical protein DX130_22885 [Paenibacillus paeoniae]